MDIAKAKIAIVNDLREILVLTRSASEETRQGEHDLPGGTLEPSDVEVVNGALREAREELPGARLRNPTELGQPHRKINELGGVTTTFVFGATAIFPEKGIRLSDEHEAFEWIPASNINRSPTLPKKYKQAILGGLATFDWLLSKKAP